MTGAPRLAVVGGGWAGLAAAVEATQRGNRVTLFDMAPQLGGRARAVYGDGPGDGPGDGETLDNGQHILIGAYTQTLQSMRTVGVDLGAAFLRTPLRLSHADGSGLHLPPGPPAIAFARAVWARREWRTRERLALLRAALGWRLAGFRCDPQLTVAELTSKLPSPVRRDLIDPLCVAALNTPAATASASVFLRVLGDALLSGPGSADVLLPRTSLSNVFPIPAERWLRAAGAVIELGLRVRNLIGQGAGWLVDGAAFDRVVLATTPPEAARLTQAIAPNWSQAASQLKHEPIVTVYVRGEGASLPEPMLALHDGDGAPAQFVFDRGQLGGSAGLLAFVISGAAPWVARGSEATLEATVRQARAELTRYLPGPLHRVRVLTEKRATFCCTPGLRRPGFFVAPQLHAAGDHIDGPYPATLEGAVRSGIDAVSRFV